MSGNEPDRHGLRVCPNRGSAPMLGDEGATGEVLDERLIERACFSLISAVSRSPMTFFSQVEYCDNLIFRRRAALDNLGERLLDADRTIGQPNKITVIFGRKVTKQYRGKLQTEIEDMNLPNPVVRSHYRNGFIKQYVRDHLILRTEAASNNVNDYGVNKP